MTAHNDPISNSPKPVAGYRPETPEKAPRREQDAAAGAKDRVSLGQGEAVEKTYAPPEWMNIGSNYELLRRLVVKTLEEQNVPLQISTGAGDIDLTQLSVEEAQALIADDGYFGVEQTSDRIVDFAINAFGRDKSRLEEMKKAIDKGFQDAQQVWGGMLPEISQNTYDAIMQKLDAFAAELNETGD